jgi:hypothetical protein
MLTEPPAETPLTGFLSLGYAASRKRHAECLTPIYRLEGTLKVVN